MPEEKNERDFLNEQLVEAEKEIDAEPTSEKVVEEPKQETEPSTETDEGSEIPTEFRDHPRWKQIYSRMKEAESGVGTKDEEIAELREQLSSLKESMPKEEPKAETPQMEDVDPTEFARFMYNWRKVDVSKLTPEQYEFYKFVYAMNLQTQKDIRDKLQKGEKETQEQQVMRFHSEEMERAKKYVGGHSILNPATKKPYTWNEVERELSAVVDKNERMRVLGQQFGIYQLLKDWIFDKGLEIGKLKAKEEQAKLNEKKRKQLVESATPAAIGTAKKDYSTSEVSERQMLKELMEDAEKQIEE